MASETGPLAWKHQCFIWIYTGMQFTKVMELKLIVNAKFDAWIIHILHDFYEKLWTRYRL